MSIKYYQKYRKYFVLKIDVYGRDISFEAHFTLVRKDLQKNVIFIKVQYFLPWIYLVLSILIQILIFELFLPKGASCNFFS